MDPLIIVAIVAGASGVIGSLASVYATRRRFGLGTDLEAKLNASLKAYNAALEDELATVKGDLDEAKAQCAADIAAEVTRREAVESRLDIVERQNVRLKLELERATRSTPG